MSVKGLEFEGLKLRAKVPIPFVEENFYLPQRVFVDGYFPVGTLFTFDRPVCSQKMNSYGEQTNDYCHAAALKYNNRENGADASEEEVTIVFHVDLSAMFSILEPVDDNGKVIPL